MMICLLTAACFILGFLYWKEKGHREVDRHMLDVYESLRKHENRKPQGDEE